MLRIGKFYTITRFIELLSPNFAAIQTQGGTSGKIVFNDSEILVENIVNSFVGIHVYIRILRKSAQAG